MKPDEFLIIKNGVVQRLPDHARAGARGSTGGTSSSRARRSRTAARTPTAGAACSSSACLTCRCCRASNDRTWDDLIAATDSGIAIIGDGSFSIDQQRYNAQFGGQLFYEIKGGKIVGMLKDVAYQMRTPEFWNSMDMIGGQVELRGLGLASSTARDSRARSNAVSHGSRAGALPQRQRHQHRPKGVRDPIDETLQHHRGPSGPERLLDSRASRQRAAPSSRARKRRRSIERVVTMSKADGIDVQVGGGYTTNVRFADNQMSTAGARHRFHRRRAELVREEARGRADERDLRRGARAPRSTSPNALAKLAPDDPGSDADARPAAITGTVKAYFPSVAAMSAGRPRDASRSRRSSRHAARRPHAPPAS